MSYPAPPPPPPRRGWLHLALLASTFVTLAFAGLVGWGAGSIGEGVLFAVLVLAIIGSHEMGHYITCRWYGLHASLPYFIPSIPPLGTFGAVIRIRSRVPHRNALFDIAIAGPVAGFLVALPILIVGYLRAVPAEVVTVESGMYFFGPSVAGRLLRWALDLDGPLRTNVWIGAGWIGMFVTSLNLFPAGQLDGGHIAYAISRRFHRAIARATIVALGSFIAYQVFFLRVFPAYVVWFALLLWLRDRHPPLLNETTPLTEGRRRFAWVAVPMFTLSLIPFPFYFAA